MTLTMKAKRVFIALAIISILFPLSLFGGITGKINGHVKDQNGQILSGANILLTGTNRGAAADKNGYFVYLERGTRFLQRNCTNDWV